MPHALLLDLAHPTAPEWPVLPDGWEATSSRTLAHALDTCRRTSLAASVVVLASDRADISLAALRPLAHAPTYVIAAIAAGGVRRAAAAMRGGAHDCIPWPLHGPEGMAIWTAALSLSLAPAPHPLHLASAPSDLASVERIHIARILTLAGGNRAAAARQLAISRSTLYTKLKLHNIRP